MALTKSESPSAEHRDMLKKLAREMNEIAAWLERFEDSKSAPLAARQLRGGAVYLKSLTLWMHDDDPL